MSITPTTPQDPLASPSTRTPEVPELYDASNWENAYRHFDEDAVPQLLLHLQDDLTRARRREAAWLSVIVHLLVIILFVNQPRIENLYRRVFLHQQPVMSVSVQDLLHKKELTYLELPPDVQKLTRRPDPNTKFSSDRDRIATSRTPQLDPKELKKIIDSSRAGRPGQPSPQGSEQAPVASATGPANSGPPAPEPGQQPPPQQNQTAQLQPPQVERTTPPVTFGGSMSAGSAIEQATRAAAQRRGAYGGDGGDFGLSQGKSEGTLGPMEVLTDTMGVDFGPYLNRVLHDVREHWYQLIPESAQYKKGKVVLEFDILKDGSVAGLKIVGPSGDIALDRPAYGSITGSNPFPPLPKEFLGPYLGLRFSYYYNLNYDGSDIH